MSLTAGLPYLGSPHLHVVTATGAAAVAALASSGLACMLLARVDFPRQLKGAEAESWRHVMARAAGPAAAVECAVVRPAMVPRRLPTCA